MWNSTMHVFMGEWNKYKRLSGKLFIAYVQEAQGTGLLASYPDTAPANQSL